MASTLKEGNEIVIIGLRQEEKKLLLEPQFNKSGKPIKAVGKGLVSKTMMPIGI